MKRIIAFSLILSALFFFFIGLRAHSREKTVSDSKTEAQTEQSELKPFSSRAVKFAVSPAISSFAPAQPEHGKTSRKIEKLGAREIENEKSVRESKPNAVHDRDAAFAQITEEMMPAPLLSFEGLNSDDNAAAFGFRAVPPDATGDVGPGHFVQAVNLLFRVFDKQGNALTPPFKISSLLAPLNTPCAQRDDGDPIVLYDPLADRWILSSFCTLAPPFRQMIAVSTTNDPTGSYYVYEFVMPNAKFNDYPKFGVWSDAYYMTTDQFLGQDFAGTGAFAFDREKMLAGAPDAGFIYYDLSTPSTIRLGGMLPTDFDGLRPPPTSAPQIFASYTATEYGDPADALRLFDFRPNFLNPAASSFTERPESPIQAAAFDPTSPEDRLDISQPPPGDFLDSQSDRLMYRVAYRNFGASESLVLNQTVRVSSANEAYRAGVRIYELRKNAPDAPFTIQTQTTTPFADLSRWMASAAQDNQGNLAFGYSSGGGAKKPSIHYSGRLTTDAPNSFRLERELIAGTGVQTAFGNRWGDYTSMTVDPADDCTFWYTNEYYTLESQEKSPFGWLTRIGKFKFPSCPNAPRGNLNGIVSNAATNQPIAHAQIKTNFAHSRASAFDGNYNFAILPGVYTLTVSAAGFRSQTVTVNVNDGETVVRNFALHPIAVLQNAGIDFIAESCNRNSAFEPGETVTINLPLRNTGARATASLTATLLAAGGVTNPSAPQNYGAIAVNQTAVRPFTFTASTDLNCGEPLTLTFQLNDGAENLGTITQIFNAGARKIALSESVSIAQIPALPNGWLTAATGAQQPWQSVLIEPTQNDKALFSDESIQPGVNELVSPIFYISSGQAQLTFRNKYNLETTFLRNQLYDGAVLEIRLNGSAWRDILVAGGSFETGGYDGRLSNCCQNPLAGRLAWSGRSGIGETPIFIMTKVNLPIRAVGKKIQLRWRVGTDAGTRREGIWIDNIEVSDGFVCSCGNPSAASLSDKK